MRKRLILVFSLLVVMMGVNAYDFKEGELCYKVTYYDKYVSVTYEKWPSPTYSSLSSNLEIPETVTHDGKTYTITAIGDEAFCFCSMLTSVSIPNSVTSIGKKAFTNCRNISSIDFGDAVTKIDDQAFVNCYGFTRFEIPSSVTSIGASTFYGCINLEELVIPASVREIGTNAFGYSGLMRVDAYPNPDDVTLGEEIFAGIYLGMSKLHVLPKYLSAYQTADQWKEFGNNIIGDLVDGKKGDLNGDGDIDSGDVSIMLEMVLAGGAYSWAADMNDDDSVDSGDVSILLELVLSGE